MVGKRWKTEAHKALKHSLKPTMFLLLAGLKQYFSQFGKVDHCLIMRDPSTSRSRGFAFLTFADPKAVNSVMVKEHYLDGKMIDPKRAIPRQENVRTAKCFVGGVPSTATSESFRAFFAQYGNVLDSTLMMDRETQKPRGYGFVTYDNDATVERLLQIDALAMDGKMVRTFGMQREGCRACQMCRHVKGVGKSEGWS